MCRGGGGSANQQLLPDVSFSNANAIVVFQKKYLIGQTTLEANIQQTNKLRGMSPGANYTDRPIAVCRRS
jgi:hypothetical protein